MVFGDCAGYGKPDVEAAVLFLGARFVAAVKAVKQSRQRHIETALRKKREEISLLEMGGADEDDILAAKAKYHALSSEYSQFSKAMSLPQQRERISIDGRKGVDVSFGKSATEAKMSKSRKYRGTVWQNEGTKISDEEYQSLLEYASKKGVKLVSFENFDGDTSLIRNFIDGISAVTKEFPILNSGKTRIQLHNSFLLDEDTFAKTIGNKIFINDYAYRNKQLLLSEYSKLERKNGLFPELTIVQFHTTKWGTL